MQVGGVGASLGENSGDLHRDSCLGHAASVRPTNTPTQAGMGDGVRQAMGWGGRGVRSQPPFRASQPSYVVETV